MTEFTLTSLDRCFLLRFYLIVCLLVTILPCVYTHYSLTVGQVDGENSCCSEASVLNYLWHEDGSALKQRLHPSSLCCKVTATAIKYIFTQPSRLEFNCRYLSRRAVLHSNTVKTQEVSWKGMRTHAFEMIVIQMYSRTEAKHF